jgi:RNA polymerase sigma factor (sigma-70 family)
MSPSAFLPTGHPEDADAAAEFARQIARHRRSVEGMLCRLLPSADVEDVYQETVLHAYLGRSGLRQPDQFGAWLRTIAYHRAMQWQRRRYAEAERWPRLWQPEEEEGDVATAETRLDVTEALGLLAPGDRQLVLLRYVQGMSSAEIAVLMGGKATTVRSRLHRATHRLRGALEASGQASDGHKGKERKS